MISTTHMAGVSTVASTERPLTAIRTTVNSVNDCLCLYKFTNQS